VTTPPDDLLSIFWVEAADYLEALNRLLLQLEVAAPGDDAIPRLREVTRIAHSLKGAARAVGQTAIETLAHHMEDLFDLALAGRLTLNPGVCDALYDSLDVIQLIADGAPVSPEVVEEAVHGLQSVASGDGSAAGDGQPGGTAVELSAMPGDSPAAAVHATGDTVRVSLGKLDQLMGQTSELLLARMHSEQRHQDVQELLDEHRRWRRLWRQARSAYIRATRRLRDAHSPAMPAEGSADLFTLLDFLESTQHYITESGRRLAALGQALAQDSLHLTALVDELQADIASVRMLPFATILGAFQRMVRDLARAGGKEAILVVEGAQVELDKHVLEMLKDPLMHLLRNAVDHGIEPPDARAAAGKPPAGTIRLTVSSRGNDIHVAVRDDGRGIDPQAVGRRALEAGLISELDVENLSDSEITALIFEPGFSTAQRVTPLSGRGLGLDVVRQRVEALRGRLWVENHPGQGATFHLIVPVSLTRTRCLLARIGEETYAIPLTSVTRITTIDPATVFAVESRPMIEIDGRPIPLVHLATVLERPAPPAPLTPTSPVLILHSTEQRQVAFIIDELVSEQELVLKALGEELGRVRNVAGAAILGSGEVVIVLNPSDLIKSARRARAMIARAAEAATGPEAGEPGPPRILVVDDSLTTRTLEKNILEAAGFRVRTATDGDEALRVLLEHPIDVIISDIEMPGLNGFDLTRRLKAYARWRDIPLILVTSRDSPGDRERGLQAGADAYVAKSEFDQDELLRIIGQMV